ncbi:DUF433 domain-containing protein [Gordonia polyisoprenivorans]
MSPAAAMIDRMPPPPQSSNTVMTLQDRPVYGFGQVDHILGLKPGTAGRWIDGYRRGGKTYPPIIRPRRSGDEIVTWGEFIEARLLAEYRGEGALVARMRPAIEKLRERLNTRYPLASAKLWLAVENRELVWQVQEQVGLDKRLFLVVIRNDQEMLHWSREAQDFADSLHWSEEDTDAAYPDRQIVSLNPDPSIREVVVDPMQRFGEPTTRGVPTDIIRELYAAGDPIDMIADLYELSPHQVEAAVRYELKSADAYSARAS